MKWFRDRFKYAFEGIRDGIIRDKSIRFQFVAALMALAAGMVLQIDVHEWCWVLLAITLVLAFEIMNSCIEKTVDYISEDRDPRAKLIKDMAAGAVFLVSLFALIIALLILLPRFLELISRILEKV